VTSRKRKADRVIDMGLLLAAALRGSQEAASWADVNRGFPHATAGFHLKPPPHISSEIAAGLAETSLQRLASNLRPWINGPHGQHTEMY
jgi:hypothetical protein